jgi:multimeric flavodoxin WrbA
LSANTVMEEPLSEQKMILVLFGSPHKNGFTAKLLNDFLVPIESAAEIQVIDAYKSNIGPCTACDACTRAETCSQRDFDAIDALIRRADVIVVATPVYSLSFPSPLKAIVDRTQRYFSARFSLGVNPPVAKHKTAVLLVTSGSKNLDGAHIISRQLRMIFSVMNTSLDNEVVWSDTDYNGGEETYEAAREHANNLALAIKCEL